MKLLKYFAVIVPLVILQACATVPPPPPPMAVTDLSGKTCATEPSTTNAVSLTPVKKQIVHTVSTLVDVKSPCLSAGDGSLSNYVVYAIPASGENHTITVGGVQEAIRTFAPTVTLLQADGKVTRTFGEDRFALLGNTLGVQFRPLPAERFIVVQSNPGLVGQSVATVETRITSTYGYAAPTAYSYGYSYTHERGADGKHERTFSHEGYISVTVQAATGKVGLPNEK
ncbi:hypothetical protein [Asticcacaulis sp. AC402]|uniref:hypothetical protein n=1 Tax=Asticcacaulis sp. AC402 TaxID=1282361 RepID=UPI0003C3B1E0|nr:hypothetical protein [Asticcacaulis sp. AC402]ESQ76688.1 hypothetical protein ABAC402_03155 [Asticcacaulis sp. AC402]